MIPVMYILTVVVLLNTVVPSVWPQHPDYCVKADYGQTILKVEDQMGCGILQCYNMTVNETDYDDYSFQGWILPNLLVLDVNYSDARMWVSEDNSDWTLTVTNITKTDVGLYHCLVQNEISGKLHVIRFGLNSKGPFFITRWEEYKMNTIVGCASFAGFLLIVLVVYLLWDHRWRPEKDDLEDITMTYEAYKEPHRESGSVSSASSKSSSVKRRNVGTDGDHRQLAEDRVIQSASTANGIVNVTFENDGFYKAIGNTESTAM